MAVITDNRAENEILHALQKLLPNLRRIDVATGVFKVGSFSDELRVKNAERFLEERTL